MMQASANACAGAGLRLRSKGSATPCYGSADLKMTNNDVLRMVRYALELHNPAVLELFAFSNSPLQLVDLDAMLRDDDDAGYVAMSDELLGAMLDGLVVKHRGTREPAAGETRRADAPQPALTNNRILRALRIALELKDTDVLAI